MSLQHGPVQALTRQRHGSWPHSSNMRRRKLLVRCRRLPSKEGDTSGSGDLQNTVRGTELSHGSEAVHKSVKMHGVATSHAVGETVSERTVDVDEVPSHD